MLIIDYRMRDIEKNALEKLNYNFYELKSNPNLYFEISAHPDIHCIKIKENIICDSNLEISNSIIGQSILKNNYPLDIAYNVCIIDNIAIHNFKYTEPKILQILNKFNFKKIHINQGYSKCSIAVIDKKSVIVTDKKIAQTLENNGLEVLLVDEAINKNIHLYKNEKLQYSNMTGFIGGVLSRIDNFVFVSGDLKYIDYDNKIRNFIEKRKLQIIDFPNCDIIDYGGIINI